MPRHPDARLDAAAHILTQQKYVNDQNSCLAGWFPVDWAVTHLSLLCCAVLAGAASRWLEAAVAGRPEQKQQQQINPAEMVLGLFDHSLLKYKERDELLETFQKYRCGVFCCTPELSS